MAFSPEEQAIIKYGAQNGKSRAEVEDALTKFRTGYVPQQQAPQQAQQTIQSAQQPSFLSRVSTDIQNRGAMVADTMATPSPTYLGAAAQGTKAAAQVAGGITDVVGEAINSVPYVRDAAKWLGNLASRGANAVVGALAGTDLIKGAAQSGQTKNLEDALSIGQSLGEVSNNVLLAQGVAKGAQGAVDATQYVGKKIAQAGEGVANSVMNSGGKALKLGQELRGKAQSYIGGESSNPQLGSAASRLSGNASVDKTLKDIATSGKDWDAMIKDGTVPRSSVYTETGALQPARSAHVLSDISLKLESVKSGLGDKFRKVVDTSNPTAASLQKQAQDFLLKETGSTKPVGKPIDIYNSDLPQAKKALTDIKVDPPIAKVGEEIGDAFRDVIAQRRAAGQAMSNELKGIANVKTNIAPAGERFLSALDDNGVRYNPATESIDVVGATKMASTDLKMLGTFAKELERLGPNPTLAQLDAFMSRLPNELNVYKAANGIMGTTNAERIVQNTLSSMREQFSPAVTGNPALTGYYNARSTYAQLSDFMDEGQGFLGKITQSGDFAKDASLAKSAVQSILNNGKKDWLIQLEGLTGYPALDRSVIALQAMKDAGDFRGLSLLQTLSSGGVPTASGLTERILSFVYDMGKRTVLGTPEEQTRAFLSNLSKTPTK